jgi:transglutaminase-like putative cysteine protease
MLIRFGSEIEICCAQDTAGLAMLALRPERQKRILQGGTVEIDEDARSEVFIDPFGNRCLRFIAPAGRPLTLSIDGIVRDDGTPDRVPPTGERPCDPGELPAEVLRFLMASRYCESDVLGSFAWSRFGATPPGWRRVQAVCDFVHDHLRFSYPEASPTRTAAQALEERVGVCRDFAHLAIALCRALGIPARYCTGYLGDIGVPPAPSPMDFSAWFEVYLGDRWHAFDARHNVPRIGRLPIACGLDATDVAVITTFGPHELRRFTVWTDELPVSDIAARGDAPVDVEALAGSLPERRRIVG